MIRSKIRLAIIVSHPIQYYTPLYKRLAQRDDVSIKVFFTWHAGQTLVEDRGFRTPVAWDIPLLEGYEFELVPNISRNPGTHRFLGLNNPSLVKRVMAWQPDVVHITGWAWLSHLMALRAFFRNGTLTLFRGDSHLLDQSRQGPRWLMKRALLRHIYSWPTGFLAVGTANRTYYQSFGVNGERLFLCPHSIDVNRFANPARTHEQNAARWRKQLGIADDQFVLLFAGKFERKKCPLELMHVAKQLPDPKPITVMVGGGELESEVKELAATDPQHFRILPFQNQSRMPVVYRLGSLFVLPSKFGETWGLAVNEALACGRPVLVSERVGCATDVVNSSCGYVFSWSDAQALRRTLLQILQRRDQLADRGRAASDHAWSYDIRQSEKALMDVMRTVCTL